jgi:hypothetical protein
MSRTGSAAVPRFAPIDGAVLESLYQHRLLSTRQVAVLHTPDAPRRTAQRILARLRAAELADCTREPGGLALWFVTPQGAEATEAVPNRAEMRRKLIRPEHAAGPLRHHTLAVNDVGIAFVQAARERGHECGPLAWRHEIAHPLGPSPGRRQPEQVIADALLTYQLAERDDTLSFHYRLLELDRGTMPAADLAAKLTRYARLYHHALPPEDAGDEAVQLWTRFYPVFPTVLIVLAHQPRPTLERRRQTVLALARQDPELRDCPEVAVSICLLDDLTEHGPFAPIFRTNSDPATPTSWLGDGAR